MERLHILDHPAAAHKLNLLRQSGTHSKEFRELTEQLALLLCYEATRDLPLTAVEISTPVANATVGMLKQTKLAVCPILRAGLGMVGGVTALYPQASIAVIGVYREEKTLKPVEYYCKLPKDIAERRVLVVDPMLATGGSAVDAIGQLRKRGVQHVKLLCLVAAPQGVGAVLQAFPDVEIYCAALDQTLNEHGYIVPGLGDAGDRLFATE